MRATRISPKGNCATALYPFVGSYMPLSWPYPSYNSMYMQPFIISYPNYGALQQPIAGNSNLVKGNACTNVKQCVNNNKLDSKYLQPRWCPSGLSLTQNRRLQWLCKQESMVQRAEVVPKRVSDNQAGMEAKASCFIVSLR